MAGTTDGSDQLLCSFCGKSQRQVKKLIAGPGVYICDECIDLCNEIIDEELTAPATLDLEQLPKPHDIYDILNDYVVGQDEAKRSLAVAVYNHYKRVQAVTSGETDVELQKSNILLLGPTGCGKTLLAQTLARILNVPFAIADATALTEAGYVGEDVENILLKLIQAADFDVKRAETGIIYIDEIDKIARKADKDPGTIFTQVLPEDLLDFGLIPEFIGRLPVVSAVHNLDENDLMRILTEPKNALTRQYQKFLSLDGVELVFADEALSAIAAKALKHGTGARGLRSIIEESLMGVMFDLPSRTDVRKCVITKETIEKGIDPTLLTEADKSMPERDAESA